MSKKIVVLTRNQIEKMAVKEWRLKMKDTYLMVNGQKIELTAEQKKQLGIVEDIFMERCPFCGQRAAEVKKLIELQPDANNLCHPHYYSVRCNFHNGGCGTTLGGEYKTEEEAIKAWNTRLESVIYDY